MSPVRSCLAPTWAKRHVALPGTKSPETWSCNREKHISMQPKSPNCKTQCLPLCTSWALVYLSCMECLRVIKHLFSVCEINSLCTIRNKWVRFCAVPKAISWPPLLCFRSKKIKIQKPNFNIRQSALQPTLIDGPKHLYTLKWVLVNRTKILYFLMIKSIILMNMPFLLKQETITSTTLSLAFKLISYLKK